jgi:hypothetical protein
VPSQALVRVEPERRLLPLLWRQAVEKLRRSRRHCRRRPISGNRRADRQHDKRRGGENPAGVGNSFKHSRTF